MARAVAARPAVLAVARAATARPAVLAAARAVGERAAAKAGRKSVVHSQCNPCPMDKERHPPWIHLRPRRQQSLHGYLPPSTGRRRLH